MPVIVQLTKQLESVDCSQVLLEDTTGNYDAGTNPNGYGAPNAARADLALFLLPRFYDSVDSENDDLAQSLVLSGNDDPLNATQWVLQTDQDGYYPSQIAWVFTHTAGLPINTGDYIYDTVNNQLYRSTIDSNNVAPSTDLTNWVEGAVTDDEFAIFLASSSQANNVDFIIICRTEDCYKKFTSQVTKNILANPNRTGCACLNRNRLKWERLHLLYNGAIALDQQSRFTEAGDVLRTLTNMCNDINCEDCKC